MELALGLAVALPAVSQGGSWSRYRLPQSGQQLDGFICDVRMIDPNGFGYMPLQLDATSTTGQFPADRRITVDLRPTEGANWPRPSASYRVHLDLPEGESSVTVTHYLPKYFAGSSFEIVLSEGGRPLEGYALERSSWNGYGALRAAAVLDVDRYALILPDSSATAGASATTGVRVPDLRTLDSLEMPDVAYLKSTQVTGLSAAEALAYLRHSSPTGRQVMHESEAHLEWLGYEAVDIVIVSFEVLERMREADPRRFAALREWVACGGAVWTYGVESPQKLTAVFESSPTRPGSSPAGVPLPQLPEIAEGIQTYNALKAIPPHDWILQQARTESWTEDELLYLAEDAGSRWKDLVARSHPVAKFDSDHDLQQSLFPQPVMAGIVIGFKDPDPFPGSFQLWHVAKHLTASRQVWSLKHGTPLLGGTTNFWDWTLENVARPPVYAFLGVLTGFVVLVGPVSYHFTRRRGRTYLMFVIAPVLATIATLMLFGYGLVADGLGTQARIRQITWSEGSSGRAARLTRSTYFAGFRPEGGLRFSLDSAVYPILDVEEGYRMTEGERPRHDRSIWIGDENQQLRGEFMPARRQRQFVATRPIDDAGSVGLVAPTSQPARIRNDFKLKILQICARDSDGDYWTHSKPLGAGEEVVATALPASGVDRFLRELYEVETPAPPSGYSPYNGRRIFSSSYSNMGWSGPQYRTNFWFQSNAELGVFEARLRTMLLDRGEIPKGWFVGHAELSDEEIAVEGATPVSSVHFVMGVLR